MIHCSAYGGLATHEAGTSFVESNAGLVAQRREWIGVHRPRRLAAGQGIGQGGLARAGAQCGIEAAGEGPRAERKVVRVDPGMSGGEPAGRLVEGQAGDEAVAQRGRDSGGAGIEPGERVLGCGQGREQGGEVGLCRPAGGRDVRRDRGRGGVSAVSSASSGVKNGSGSVSDADNSANPN